MGKLYYVTGNNEQTRRLACNAIFQWSQAQQAQILQPWPMQHAQPANQPSQQPNLYLYNYLAQGNAEALVQLTETYGEEAVEPIYLRMPEETEAALLEKGIYNSYDPQTNLPQCLQEIVETVFTGYRAVQYDFAAVIRQLQQEQMQQVRYAQPQAAHNPQAQPENTQAPAPKPTNVRKRWALRIVAVVVWIAVVCVLTASIYNGVTQPDHKKGQLVKVTATPEKSATEQFPGWTPIDEAITYP